MEEKPMEIQGSNECDSIVNNLANFNFMLVFAVSKV